MTTPNNQPTTHEKRILAKRPKENDSLEKESLSFATWVLLIISFTCLAYAIYTIQMRIMQSAVDTDNASGAQSSLVQTDN